MAWFSRSAEHGYIDAKFKLGIKLLFWIDGNKDHSAANNIVKSLDELKDHTNAREVFSDYFEPGGRECLQPSEGGGLFFSNYCMGPDNTKPSNMGLKVFPP